MVTRQTAPEIRVAFPAGSHALTDGNPGWRALGSGKAGGEGWGHFGSHGHKGQRSAPGEGSRELCGDEDSGDRGQSGRRQRVDRRRDRTGQARL